MPPRHMPQHPRPMPHHMHQTAMPPPRHMPMPGAHGNGAMRHPPPHPTPHNGHHPPPHTMPTGHHPLPHAMSNGPHPHRPPPGPYTGEQPMPVGGGYAPGQPGAKRGRDEPLHSAPPTQPPAMRSTPSAATPIVAPPEPHAGGTTGAGRSLCNTPAWMTPASAPTSAPAGPAELPPPPLGPASGASRATAMGGGGDASAEVCLRSPPPQAAPSLASHAHRHAWIGAGPAATRMDRTADILQYAYGCVFLGAAEADGDGWESRAMTRRHRAHAVMPQCAF